MGKKISILLPLCLLVIAAVWVSAAGDAGDPLASLSYLNGVFTNKVDSAVDSRLDNTGNLWKAMKLWASQNSNAGFIAGERVFVSSVTSGGTNHWFPS